MRLGIQHPIIQTHNARLRKDQVKILERLREPKRLHAVRFRRIFSHRDIVQGRIGNARQAVPRDRVEHHPRLFLEDGVAGDAVEDED